MARFAEGDRVRVDTPDETDPEHEEYHKKHREVVAILTDDAGTITTDGRDSQLYRVTLETGGTVDFRWRGLRPPINNTVGYNYVKIFRTPGCRNTSRDDSRQYNKSKTDS